MKLREILLTLLTAAVLTGCNQPGPTGQSPTQPAAPEQTYDTRGVVRTVADDRRSFVVRHEEIPGYMAAMTMELNVRATNELAGVQTGDVITFRLCVTTNDAWVDRVKRTGLTFQPESLEEPATTAFAEELPVGAPLPDRRLTNHLGRPFHLSDFTGRALAFTFIFTRCPLPTYCPRMNGHFAVARDLLATDAARTNWHLLSISFDPNFDTPAQLAAYASGYRADPRHWTFATSAPDIIHQLGGGFGLVFAPEGASFSHNLRTVVVDARGRVHKVFPGNEWQPAELVTALREAMSPKE